MSLRQPVRCNVVFLSKRCVVRDDAMSISPNSTEVAANFCWVDSPSSHDRRITNMTVQVKPAAMNSAANQRWGPLTGWGACLTNW